MFPVIMYPPGSAEIETVPPPAVAKHCVQCGARGEPTRTPGAAGLFCPRCGIWVREPEPEDDARTTPRWDPLRGWDWGNRRPGA